MFLRHLAAKQVDETSGHVGRTLRRPSFVHGVRGIKDEREKHISSRIVRAGSLSLLVDSGCVVIPVVSILNVSLQRLPHSVRFSRTVKYI